MTIYKNDIKLFESKVMTDESDGGGAMTGVEIVSGQHNSIFPDISDLNRAYGDVGIRSVHLKVDAPNNDTYFGATIGVTENPVDPNVEITLMSVNNPYIQRDETKEIIERYLTSGVKFQGELFYTQVAGQRAIRIMQYTTRKSPSTGEVLIVRNKITGFEQYCKIVKVTSEIQNFTTSNHGAFQLKIVTCEISEPLRETLTGSEPTPHVTAISQSEISETTVADASEYFGMKSLKVDASFNTSSIQVNGTYNQLVPSARIDNAHVNVPIVELANAPVAINASGTETITLPINLESQSFPINIDNQGYVYVQTLVPYPTPETLLVHYLSQGNWYTLKDDGTGILKGLDPSHGSGTLDEFGNVSVTTGALPDITSEMIFQWGSSAIQTELMVDSDLSLDKTLVAVCDTQPNSDDMIFTWEGKTATCVDGVITGDATGTVSGKSISFTPNSLPTAGAVIETSWTANAGGLTPRHWQDTTISMVDNGTQYVFNVGAESTVSGSRLNLQLQYVAYSDENGRPNTTQPTYLEILNFAEGNIVRDSYFQNVGAYNKSTGDVTIEKSLLKVDLIVQEWEQKRSHWWKSKSWTVSERSKVRRFGYAPTLEVIARKWISQSVTTPIGAGTFNFTADNININISDTGTNTIAETVRFDLNGKTYTIDGDQVIENSAQVGTYDADTDKITLQSWGVGADAIALQTGLFQFGVKAFVQSMVFLTAGNPVANRSLQINAIDVNGTHVTGVADVNGVISGGGFEGTIDPELGIVLLNNSNPVEALDIKYNCVSYNYLPLDADLLGLDPIRLPSDGRVVIFKKGDVIVIHQEEELTETVTTGQVLDLNEVRLATCETTAIDAVIDLDAGTILFPTGGTYDIKYRFEDMALLTYVDISGAMKISQPLSHDYTADKAKVASLLIAGDLFARYTNLFDQKTWTGDFSDNLIGDESQAQYNDTLYPIQVTNDGCITERFAIVFTNSTNFKLIGENTGQNFSGDINTDFSPINPTSGKPYFTINKLGWGTGWATNNVLRINFVGAVYQMNVIRTILQGESQNPTDSDSFALQVRGNTNKDIV